MRIANTQIDHPRRETLSNSEIFADFIKAFTSGDIDSALDMITDDFTFSGPILQAEGKEAFAEGAVMAATVATGITMHRQVEQGDNVVSMYDFELGEPAMVGKVSMTEWNTIRDGKIASSRLFFDTAAFNALMPQG